MSQHAADILQSCWIKRLFLDLLKPFAAKMHQSSKKESQRIA